MGWRLMPEVLRQPFLKQGATTKKFAFRSAMICGVVSSVFLEMICFCCSLPSTIYLYTHVNLTYISTSSCGILFFFFFTFCFTNRYCVLLRGGGIVHIVVAWSKREERS